MDDGECRRGHANRLCIVQQDCNNRRGSFGWQQRFLLISHVHKHSSTTIVIIWRTANVIFHGYSERGNAQCIRVWGPHPDHKKTSNIVDARRHRATTIRYLFVMCWLYLFVVKCLSGVCQVFVMCLSSVCQVFVRCLSGVCQVFVRCVLRFVLWLLCFLKNFNFYQNRNYGQIWVKILTWS